MVGNFIGAIVITKTSGPYFFGICWAIMMCAVFGFCLIVIPKEKHEEQELGEIKLAEKKLTFCEEFV